LPQYPSEYDEPIKLSPAQTKALAALAAGKSVSKAAIEAKVDRTTVHRWLNTDALFLAEYNATRLELIEAVRFEVCELRTQAIEALRDLMKPEVTASVRLRDVELVLASVSHGAPNVEIGSADPVQTKRELKEREFEARSRMNTKEDEANGIIR
jgi:hypothetical protein